MNASQQKDFQAYLEIIKKKELRSQWIRFDKLQNAIKMKLNPSQLKNSKYFLYDQTKDAVKVKYPYEIISNIQSLLEYFNSNRCGVWANMEFLVAYESISDDLQMLENKMWIFPFYEKDENKQLKKIYLVNDINFKKEQILDIKQDIPQNFQFKNNPSFFRKRIDMSQMLIVDQDNKKNFKSEQKHKQNIHIKNDHIQQEDDKVYNTFIKALKQFTL
ncbi:hypothetical protein ABPG72_009664 [Tetrahymena utriculariae]